MTVQFFASFNSGLLQRFGQRAARHRRLAVHRQRRPVAGRRRAAILKKGAEIVWWLIDDFGKQGPFLRRSRPRLQEGERPHALPRHQFDTASGKVVGAKGAALSINGRNHSARQRVRDGARDAGRAVQARATQRSTPLRAAQRQGVMGEARRSAWLALPVLVAGCGEHRVQPPVTAAGGAGCVAGDPGGLRDADRARRRARRARPVGARRAAERGGGSTPPTAAATCRPSTASGLAGRRRGLALLRERDRGRSAPPTWTLHDGDHVWWDYRRWRAYLHVPVVVGAWPEPFLHGEGGRTAERVGRSAARRRAAGPGADVGAARARRSGSLVGADADLRKREAAWRRAAAHPQREGLTVWIQDGAVRALGRRRRQGRRRPAGAGHRRRHGRATATAACWSVAGRSTRAAAHGRGAAHRRRSRRAAAPLRRRVRRAGAPVAAGGLGAGRERAAAAPAGRRSGSAPRSSRPTTRSCWPPASSRRLGAAAAPRPARAARVRCSRSLLAVPVALLNPFVAVEGDLILIPGPSLTVLDLEVTLEELLYGAAARRPARSPSRVLTGRRPAARRRRPPAGPRRAHRAALGADRRARRAPAARRCARDAVAPRRGRPPARRGARRGRGARRAARAAARRRAWSAASTRPRRWWPAATAAAARTALPERPLTAREWALAALGARLVALAIWPLLGAWRLPLLPDADTCWTAAAIAAALLALARRRRAAVLVGRRR